MSTTPTTAEKAGMNQISQTTRLLGVLQRIAEQRLSSEMPHEEQEVADFEGAYDAMIRDAREALK